ncbi:hypothetical protein C5167_035522 [Papaver somniferum]|uniref:Uncharacterized protein n=1 Tax=Papaver somniferum TaxID=3469 RepID=A0A4Y7KG40_PAPSO|nr:hypothetical protein C5167_035522 [Papaver somniferum]
MMKTSLGSLLLLKMDVWDRLFKKSPKPPEKLSFSYLSQKLLKRFRGFLLLNYPMARTVTLQATRKFKISRILGFKFSLGKSLQLPNHIEAQ